MARIKQLILELLLVKYVLEVVSIRLQIMRFHGDMTHSQMLGKVEYGLPAKIAL